MHKQTLVHAGFIGWLERDLLGWKAKVLPSPDIQHGSEIWTHGYTVVSVRSNSSNIDEYLQPIAVRDVFRATRESRSDGTSDLSGEFNQL